MKAKIKNKLENNNGLDVLLAHLAGVEDYYSREYNKKAKGGFDFDLMYDADKDEFTSCNEGEGELFERSYNMIKIATVQAFSVEDLEIAIEHYLENNLIRVNKF
jgi:hypothetical protein